MLVFVKYNGQWNENNIYIDNKWVSVLVPITTSYVGLLEILFEALGSSLVNYSMVIKYTFELGCSIMRILNDYDVKLCLELRKNEPDKTKFPL